MKCPALHWDIHTGGIYNAVLAINKKTEKTIITQLERSASLQVESYGALRGMTQASGGQRHRWSFGKRHGAGGIECNLEVERILKHS